MKISLSTVVAVCFLAIAHPVSLSAQKGYVVIAHRGGAALGNENTLSCMTAGIAAGADMVEIDVHMSADGELIVCHDAKIDRTTDGKGRIEEMTAGEIRSCHIVDAVTGEVSDEVVPLLDEVMDLVDGECSVLIEIKRKKMQYKGIEEKVVAAIRRCGAERWAVVQSFNDSVLRNVHEIAPDIRLQKLIFCRLPFRLAFDGTVTKFNYEKYDYVEAVNVNFRFASKSMIRKAHAAGKKVGVWTVRTPGQVERRLSSGDVDERIDCVVTDSPDLF